MTSIYLFLSVKDTFRLVTHRRDMPVPSPDLVLSLIRSDPLYDLKIAFCWACAFQQKRHRLPWSNVPLALYSRVTPDCHSNPEECGERFDLNAPLGRAEHQHLARILNDFFAVPEWDRQVAPAPERGRKHRGRRR